MLNWSNQSFLQWAESLHMHACSPIMTDGLRKTKLGSSVGTQNISSLSMNSLDGRKLVLLVNFAIVEITFMMTQRALIPHPVSWQQPEPGDKSPFIDVLSAALFRRHSLFNVPLEFGNQVHINNFPVSWRKGCRKTRWCKSRTSSTQSVTPVLFFWVSERTYAIIIQSSRRII